MMPTKWVSRERRADIFFLIFFIPLHSDAEQKNPGFPENPLSHSPKICLYGLSQCKRS